MKTLENKVAIITGAGSGIGKAAALLFAQEGAVVMVSDIITANGLAVVNEINKNGGHSVFMTADSAKPEDHKRIVDETMRLYGQLDIAVNNAGIGGPLSLTADYPIDDWRKVIDINLSGVFYGMKYQIPAMAGRGGSIVNIASVLGQVAQKLSPAYVAAKHGVVGLTKAAALDYADQNVRVNSIGPGYIETPLINGLDQQFKDNLISLHPIGRLGKAEEVAELILWFASNKSSFATGGYYPLDGGYLVQ